MGLSLGCCVPEANESQNYISLRGTNFIDTAAAEDEYLKTANERLDPIPFHLIDSFKKGAGVAFIGAGFSKPQGLPTYLELLEGVKNRTLMSDSDSISAQQKDELKCLWASKIGPFETAGTLRDIGIDILNIVQDESVKIIGKSNAAEFIGSILGCDKLTPNMSADLQSLKMLPLSCVLTTNWDNILEKEVF